jgi:hypothetical protein
LDLRIVVIFSFTPHPDPLASKGEGKKSGTNARRNIFGEILLGAQAVESLASKT